MDYAIQTLDLSKSYKGKFVLDGLNLEVEKGSIYGFLGPNGAGKSTTIKSILGLIKPTRGTAKIFGEDILHQNVSVRSRIGYLAQDPRYYEDLTATQMLRFTANFFFSGSVHAIEKRISEVLDITGLKDKAERPIKGFSGGERQRLGIAQAYINYPDLLILDEPAASLDPMGRHDVLKLMERIKGTTTIFYSTHILEDVQKVSDTVAILDKGRLKIQAPIKQLLSNTEKAIYTLSIISESMDKLEATLRKIPWVGDIDRDLKDESKLVITATDEKAADQELLRTILQDKSVVVEEFARKKLSLEEAFLNIVSGN